MSEHRLTFPHPSRIPEDLQTITVCTGTGCLAGGATEVINAFRSVLKENGFMVMESLSELQDNHGGSRAFLKKSGCQGLCARGPLVTVWPSGIFYVHVKAADARRIVEQTVFKGEVVRDLLYTDPIRKEKHIHTQEIPFYAGQKRQVLAVSGNLDPNSIEDYIAFGGYQALKQVYREMNPASLCCLIRDAGLRGRGGAGFSTGKKWELARIQESDKKYVICNADEGDPGAFMDRSIIEGNPHAVIEGMMIAAYAISANEGYIYIRAEYPLAVQRMRRAIADAKSSGILGNHTLGSKNAFDIRVVEGAGAFVCGEETALMASIEGKRGMPRLKPPYPAVKGLFGKPTVINNVETLVTVPLIIRRGVDEYRRGGSANSPGTKIFALTGHVINTGLIEVPMNTTLRQVILDIGGGVSDDQGRFWEDGFKAVQIGGPSGACLTKEHFDLPLDFDSLQGIGAMVGSGGMVVMNKNTCMVSIAAYFMQFTQNESCGKCTFCRIGTKRMLEILQRIRKGEGIPEDLQKLEELAEQIIASSLCGLGKTAPNPVLSTLRYFRDEYEAHILEKRCPAGACQALVSYSIDPLACTGCTLCARNCPVNAIIGSAKQPHRIDPEFCISCGACYKVCNFRAVLRG